MNSVELFAGAGGLAQGEHAAGFRHSALIEWNKDSCNTLRHNRERGATWLADTEILEEDITAFDFSALNHSVDLLAGGPPCQPFSVGGKHRGHLDPRDMFPHFVRAMRDLKPKAILVENVKGLTRKTFAEYLEYVYLRMSYPECEPRGNERWPDHLARLEKIHTSGSRGDLSYNIVFRVLNAADHGVPQKRERVFFVGFRSDLGVEWSFPEPTHSRDALLASQWITGEYWNRHGIVQPKTPPKLENILRRLESRLMDIDSKPWITVRDAIRDLPDPATPAANDIPNHVFQDGARSYPGHTGSPPDEPSKTLKAGVHGVPGGENMIAFADGSVRYFTSREAARIQTFPDEYVFTGAWSEIMRQLGNAVPVTLAARLAEGIATQLRES